MITIRSSADLERALGGLLDVELRTLLALRRDQLVDDTGRDLGAFANFVVVLARDTLAEVEAAAGFPLTGDSAPFEWAHRGPGGWIEAPIVTDDDGFSVVILARDCILTDPDLLAALRAAA